eukprot:3846265-Rhodomonas_salina.1
MHLLCDVRSRHTVLHTPYAVVLCASYAMSGTDTAFITRCSSLLLPSALISPTAGTAAYAPPRWCPVLT